MRCSVESHSVPHSFTAWGVGGDDSHTEKPFEILKVLASEPLSGRESRGHGHAFPREGTTLFQVSDSDVPVDSTHSLIHSRSIYQVALMGLALLAPEST